MSRKESAERRLAKLNHDELGKALLVQESDRGCVLVAASLLEDLLELTFRAHLRAEPASSPDDLFEGHGPLASFATKIDLAYHLELLDSDVKSSLHLLRKIRNNCAHIFHPIDFNSDRMREFRGELGSPVENSLWEHLEIPESARSRFVDRVMSLFALFSILPELARARHVDRMRVHGNDIEANQEKVAIVERKIAELEQAKQSHSSTADSLESKDS